MDIRLNSPNHLMKFIGGLGLASGAITGVLLTAPLIGIMYLLENLLDVPFVPFALFDWIARVLPGPVVTFGIDLMIDNILLLGFSVADVAKTAEQAMAVLLFLVIGVLTTAVFFAVMRSWRIPTRPVSGMVVAMLLGIPMILVSLPDGRSTLDPSLIVVGLMVPFLVWGAATLAVYRKLANKTQQPASVLTLAGETSGQAEDEVRWAKSINRREFLVRLGAASATIVVLSSGVGGLLAQRDRRELNKAIAATMDQTKLGERGPFPNAADPLTPAFGTRPEFTQVDDHYKVFLRTEPTVINIDNWTLPITGLVANPLNLTLDEIQNNFEARDQYVTLSCISGRVASTLISTTWWTGVSLQKILAEAGVSSEARYLVITSGDGFHETVDLDLIASDERIMLAYAWDGRPIPFDHGFPLRIWLPDRYGMKQPKWITGIEVTEEYQPGYWVDRGWDEVAQVKATSVIDTVAVESLIEKDGQTLVPVGGIAFAGARGISKVEVQVDDGPWQEAELRAPLSETTWVIWRYDWPFAEGNHTFEVRCTESDGTPQIVEERGNRPSGATGLHSVKEKI